MHAYFVTNALTLTHNPNPFRDSLRYLQLKEVIFREQVAGIHSSGGIGKGKREGWTERYGKTWQVEDALVESVRGVFREMDDEVGLDSRVLRDKITKVTKEIYELHEEICKAKLKMMEKVENVDELMLSKFNIQRQVER